MNKKYIIYTYNNGYYIKYIKVIWGLGIGDWGLGIGPNPQSPIPNPQSPYFLLNAIFILINF